MAILRHGPRPAIRNPADPPQGMVGLAVTAWVEPVVPDLPGRGRDRHDRTQVRRRDTRRSATYALATQAELRCWTAGVGVISEDQESCGDAGKLYDNIPDIPGVDRLGRYDHLLEARSNSHRTGMENHERPSARTTVADCHPASGYSTSSCNRGYAYVPVVADLF